MAAGTAEKPTETAPKTNGRADIDAAHAALGTSIEDGIDPGPQDPHDGDDDEATGPLQLSFAVGGKKPTCSALTMVGGKLDIPESFRKGQKIVLRVELEVGEVGFKDQTDPKTGQVVGCERRHKARVIGHSLLES